MHKRKMRYAALTQEKVCTRKLNPQKWCHKRWNFHNHLGTIQTSVKQALLIVVRGNSIEFLDRHHQWSLLHRATQSILSLAQTSAELQSRSKIMVGRLRLSCSWSGLTAIRSDHVAAPDPDPAESGSALIAIKSACAIRVYWYIYSKLWSSCIAWCHLAK